MYVSESNKYNHHSASNDRQMFPPRFACNESKMFVGQHTHAHPVYTRLAYLMWKLRMRMRDHCLRRHTNARMRILCKLTRMARYMCNNHHVIETRVCACVAPASLAGYLRTLAAAASHVVLSAVARARAHLREPSGGSATRISCWLAGWPTCHQTGRAYIGEHVLASSGGTQCVPQSHSTHICMCTQHKQTAICMSVTFDYTGQPACEMCV